MCGVSGPPSGVPPASRATTRAAPGGLNTVLEAREGFDATTIQRAERLHIHGCRAASGSGSVSSVRRVQDLQRCLAEHRLVRGGEAPEVRESPAARD
jgi:hypothetical protein